ncbi:hypothetical protein [Phaeocystidibacter marisrubri]|uniref:Uncharacterized protein n=1 Tax=Phaeocystidibacter marisrubri TaxID=1577780 RepID=A0A6L3ZIG5_9FLAO|nr:hypothetical protein [Phaeocystidibacter marisrubri]KAB2817671.1 hypothetical protein F8C82_04515 [Phaeocystidibacter marisrubri]GGH74184.1 hypothetical protein GCM10011318_19890 [Phaeocystidibacter marisrubri]
MDKQSTSLNALATLGWLFLRLIILNALILSAALALGACRYFLEPTDSFLVGFPIQLYFVTFLLSNLVYILGIVFEAVYLQIWDKKIDIRNYETKFFKISLVMILIVAVFGIGMYFIRYFA